MIVVDASAVVQLLMRHAIVPAFEAALVDHDRPVRAPHLIDVEIANALRRLVAKAEINADRGVPSCSACSAISPSSGTIISIC